MSAAFRRQDYPFLYDVPNFACLFMSPSEETKCDATNQRLPMHLRAFLSTPLPIFRAHTLLAFLVVYIAVTPTMFFVNVLIMVPQVILLSFTATFLPTSLICANAHLCPTKSFLLQHLAFLLLLSLLFPVPSLLLHPVLSLLLHPNSLFLSPLLLLLPSLVMGICGIGLFNGF